MRSLHLALAVLLVTMGATGGLAVDIRDYDFESGIPSDFSVFKAPGAESMWTVETDSGELKVAKDTDNGTIHPLYLYAGIASDFMLEGDFTVTTDFRLPIYPFPGGIKLNDSWLDTVEDPASGSGMLGILRFRTGSDHPNNDFVEAWNGGPLNATTSSIIDGEYRLTRTGSTMTAEISNGGGFDTVWTGAGYTGPAFVRLYGTQGKNPGSGTRSTTELDIRFDNLHIEADAIVPEPSTFAMAALGILGLFLVGKRRGNGKPLIKR